MGFVFVDEEEDSDDEDFLDLSILDAEEETPSSVADGASIVGEIGNSTFVFEEEIPDAKKLSSPEVKARARRGRKRSPAKMDYAGKREMGWSLFCSHMNHLPNMCEREMSNGVISPCTCPCHEQRGYVQPEPESLSGSDDEEIILFIS